MVALGAAFDFTAVVVLFYFPDAVSHYETCHFNRCIFRLFTTMQKTIASLWLWNMCTTLQRDPKLMSIHIAFPFAMATTPLLWVSMDQFWTCKQRHSDSMQLSITGFFTWWTVFIVISCYSVIHRTLPVCDLPPGASSGEGSRHRSPSMLCEEVQHAGSIGQ